MHDAVWVGDSALAHNNRRDVPVVLFQKVRRLPECFVLNSWPAKLPSPQQPKQICQHGSDDINVLLEYDDSNDKRTKEKSKQKHEWAVSIEGDATTGIFVADL